MAPAVPLLETKLHAPRRRGAVARPRLAALLDRSDQPRLTLVSAAAGFGKTTLVAEWVGDGPTTAWLSLDPQDDDPGRFWTYVVAAIESVVPGAAAATRARLEDASPVLDVVLPTLLNDLHSIDHPLVLVLDDYHVVESAEIHEAVGFLVDHLPAHVRVVMLSRADPPIALAALRAQGDLLEIRAAALRFTDDEAATYLEEAMGLTLGPGDVRVLEARTEGWIAALQLAALSMQGRADVSGFIAEFAGDDRFVLDYLVGEVLDRQGEDVGEFLLETSILSRLSGPSCDAVAGRSDSRAMLERLERANLFVVPLDDRRAWYRYHHLFAEVLRARLLDAHPERVAELHRRACDWYDAAGDPVEAVTHALAGGHNERAAHLIEQAAPSMQQRRQEVTLRSWLEAMPPEVFADRPVLTVTLVGARMATGDPTGVETLLDRIDARLEPSQPAPIVVDEEMFEQLPAQLQVYRAALALLRNDLDGAVDHAEQALALVGPGAHLSRGSAAALVGLARWADGDLGAAEQRYEEAIDGLTAADRLPDVLGCSLALADIQLAQGRLGDAARTFDAGLRITAEHPGVRGAADMHVGLSEVLIDRGDLEGAARHLEASDALGERAGLPQHAYRWRVAAARLAQARGDLPGALELLEEAVARYATDFSPPVRPVTALRARAQLAAGDLAAPQAWVAEEGLGPHDELRYVDEVAHLTLARVLLAAAAEGDEQARTDADQLLRRMLATAEDGGRAAAVIEALVLLADAEATAGDPTSAMATLEEALRRAEPEGHVRVFLDAGPRVVDLLSSVVQGERGTTFGRRVLAAGTASARPAPETLTPSASGLVEDLSAREHDVLRLLRSDMGGPEIARELHVSLNTFRTHTKNIYAKLGVNTRREAVRRAAELGL